ncbi:pentapeptide repeat-containing protein [Streptomyces albogriseolus]|uniref:pentapeptide repeat-containing protein n=1 Tax=Streptomyces albogriseolus TaxID=1887 RepID=UPI00382A673A
MAFATFVPGIAAVSALLFTADSLKQNQENLKLTREGQITDRYNDAISNLGEDSQDVRLGGLYALERIMNDSPRDQVAIANVLSAYVRGHAVKPKKKPPQADKPSADVAAALDILTSSRMRFGLDLSGAHLNNAQAVEWAFTNANLRSTSLERADLSGAHLYNADLSWAKLAGVNMSYAGAVYARFDNAKLRFARLEKADLSYAHMNGADLSYARLRDAILMGANLRNANLDHAVLDGADLRGAHLASARNLTPSQFARVTIDNTTRLPKKIASHPIVKRAIAAGESQR